MIAALQMYDWPEVQGRTDVFWSRVWDRLTAAGIDAPKSLSRPADLHTPWTDAALFLGQTCGLPYVSGRAGDAVLVGRPSFGLPMAREGTYASALICHRDATGTLAAFEGKRTAINEYGSQSGCNALASAVLALGHGKDQPFFGQTVISGSHRMSATLVAEGKADVAAIDAVAWALFEEQEPRHFVNLRVMGWTAETPALPYIVSPTFAAQIDTLLAALQDASQQTSTQEIGLPTGILPATDEDYNPIRDMAASVKGLRLSPDAQALG